MNFENLILDCFDTVVAKDKTSGDLLFVLDQVKDGSLENASDAVEMTGKQGMLLSVMDRSKSSTFSCNSAYLVAGALAAQTGSDIVDASDTAKMVVPDFIRVKMKDATTCVLPNVPVGTKGAEVAAVWKVEKDGTQGKKFVVNTEPEAGKFKVEATSKTLTFNAGDLKEDDELYVDYAYEVDSGRMIANDGDKFAKTAHLLVDILLRDKCDNSVVYHGKLEIPNAKIDGNFTIDIGDEPGVHAFSARAMVDVCSKDKTLWNMYLCQ